MAFSGDTFQASISLLAELPNAFSVRKKCKKGKKNAYSLNTAPSNVLLFIVYVLCLSDETFSCSLVYASFPTIQKLFFPLNLFYHLKWRGWKYPWAVDLAGFCISNVPVSLQIQPIRNIQTPKNSSRCVEASLPRARGSCIQKLEGNCAGGDFCLLKMHHSY